VTNKSTILNKLADKLLKSKDLSDQFNSSREKSNRIKKLHESLTEKYKFNIRRGYSNTDVENDINFLKKSEKKLTLSDDENKKLDLLFFKYRI